MPTLPTFATRPKRPTRLAANPPRLKPWYGHLIAVAVLLLAYAAGYSGGRDAALGRAAAPLSPAANHPACHPNLKP
jgi:hypothetical protein